MCSRGQRQWRGGGGGRPAASWLRRCLLPTALLVSLTISASECARSQSGGETAFRHARQHNKNDSHNNNNKRNVQVVSSAVTATAAAAAAAAAAGERSSPQCPNCYQWQMEKDEKVNTRDSSRKNNINGDSRRLEFIKRQILSKLGLKTKPNVTSPVPRDVVLETLYRAGETTTVPLVHKQDSVSPAMRIGDGTEETVRPTVRSPDPEPDDFYGRTSEIITFAEPGKTLNGQTLLEFSHFQDLEGDVSGSELRVKAATFWVRVDFRPSLPHGLRHDLRDRNLTLFLFKVTRPPQLEQQYVSEKEFDDYAEMAASLPVAFSTLGWQKLDLTTTVREWYASGAASRERLRLLVDCSGCGDYVEPVLFGKASLSSSKDSRVRGQKHYRVNNREKDVRESEEALHYESHKSNRDTQRPFLVVHTDSIATKRVRRRALDCVGDNVGQCCKQKFYVNFTHLGWDDWIIAPRGYYANYCQGDCGGVHRTPDNFYNYHTHVMEEIRKVDPLSGMQPCCAPLKFSSMSLIYFSPDSNIIKRDLPKMVVDECGCP